MEAKNVRLKFQFLIKDITYLYGMIVNLGPGS